MPSPFHLSCLGEPQLCDGAGEAIRFRTRKHFALLIRLALEPGHAFSRDSLTELLWPDVPPKRARHSLAQGVSVLRAKLGRENLLVRTASVGLRAAGRAGPQLPPSRCCGHGQSSVDGHYLAEAGP